MMKKGMTLILALAATVMASAQTASVVVEQIDNQGLVDGNTYRVYVKAPSADHSVHAVFADGTNMLKIESTAPFYQSPFGNHTSNGINAAIAEIQPALNYDSYITIGANSDVNNDLWEAGINATNFEGGNSLSVEDGAWFVIPTSEQGHTNNKMVLVAQLTTTGVASGVLNVQGWDADGNVWQAIGLPFSTTASVEADEEVVDNTQSTPAAVTAAPEAASEFQVFPNPVRDNQINLQFNSVVDFTKGNLAVDVLDLSGKVIYASEITAAQMTAGNRLMVETSNLAAGVYTVNVRQADQMNVSQQVIVQK